MEPICLSAADLCLGFGAIFRAMRNKRRENQDAA